MQKKIDLINGPILSSLTKLALPIMATSLIQMAYNMIDMIWIGRLGSSAVASVGAAGMYMWLSNGLVTLARMGGQVHVGHAVGAGRTDFAGRYAATTFQMTLLLGVLYGLVCTIFSKPLIAFFHLTSRSVINDAVSYLMITCGLVIFSFLNQIFTGLFTAIGNSHPAFLSTSVGLVINFFYFLQAKTRFCFTIFIYCKLQILRKLQKFSGSGFLPVCRVLYLLAFP